MASDTKQAATISNTVDQRPAHTSSRSVARLCANLRYTSFTRIEDPQFTEVEIVDMYAAAREATTKPSSPEGRNVSIAG